MQPVPFDSSIYITALRRGDDAVLALRRFTTDAPFGSVQWYSKISMLAQPTAIVRL
jgi:hypothetical protein